MLEDDKGFIDPYILPQWFWNIIHKSDWTWDIMQKAEKSEDKLVALLMNMTKEEIFRFGEEYETAAGNLRDEPFFPYLVNSEDGIKDISRWVVSEGKEYYFSVWEKPETIPYDIMSNNLWCGVADEVYEEKFGEGETLWNFNPYD